MYKFIQFLLFVVMLQINAVPIELEYTTAVCHESLIQDNFDQFCGTLEKIFAALESSDAKINTVQALDILNRIFIGIADHCKDDTRFVVVYFEMLALHEIELSRRYRFDLFESLYSGCGKETWADSWLHKTLNAENPKVLKVLLNLASKLVRCNKNLMRVWKSTITLAIRTTQNEESLRLLLAYGADPFAMPRFFWRILIAGNAYWNMLHQVFDTKTLTQLVGEVQMFRIALRNQDVLRARHYMSDHSPVSLLTNEDTSSVADLWRCKPDLDLWKTVTKIFSADQLQDAFGSKVAFYSAVVHGDVTMAKNLLALGDSYYGNVELLEHIKEIGIIWLYIAAKYNYMDIMILLIQHGVSAQRTLLFSSGIMDHLTPIERAYAEEILFLQLEHFEVMDPEHVASRRQLTRLIYQ